MPDPTNCPVADQAELTSATAKSLVRCVKKLRRLQARCQTCAFYSACASMQTWTASINEAIAELVAERSKTP